MIVGLQYESAPPLHNGRLRVSLACRDWGQTGAIHRAQIGGPADPIDPVRQCASGRSGKSDPLNGLLAASRCLSISIFIHWDLSVWSRLLESNKGSAQSGASQVDQLNPLLGQRFARFTHKQPSGPSTLNGRPSNCWILSPRN